MKNEKAKYFYSKVEHVVKSMNTTMHLTDLDHGFGKDYHWHTYEKGLEVAKKEDKPILMVFHQDWCGACARLKPKVAESQEMKDLASQFVMINTDDEKLVKGEKYKSDGEYYPKILFLESDGELMTKEWNHGTPHKHVLHYYGDGEEISVSMKRVLANRTRAERAEDRGFGSHIKWLTYQSGLKTATDKKMPMMLIIHKTYCGACKALKPKIRNSEEIGQLSEKFVMVNCEDDEEPYEDQFDIDAAYIPRIFFLGKIRRIRTQRCNCSEISNFNHKREILCQF
jgi:thiol-disulfide isomerase/thioredoxin